MVWDASWSSLLLLHRHHNYVATAIRLPVAHCLELQQTTPHTQGQTTPPAWQPHHPSWLKIEQPLGAAPTTYIYQRECPRLSINSSHSSPTPPQPTTLPTMSSARHPPPTYASSSRTHPYRRSHEPERLPPSPPRSQHDSASLSPPLEKASIDPNDNYWDDVPAPPASLKSILDSFRRSGEGDRDLLMAILGAKKSEEERLTAIIQTRLTILQARLNLAAIQAQMPEPAMPPMPQQKESPRYYYQPRENRERESVQLPPMSFYGRDRRERSRERDVREREREVRERDPREMGGSRSPPLKSPESRGGLDMLLEGVREAERAER